MVRQIASGSALCATPGRTCCQFRKMPATASNQVRLTTFMGERGVWQYALADDPDDRKQAGNGCHPPAGGARHRTTHEGALGC
jgi:hypothetical protein